MSPNKSTKKEPHGAGSSCLKEQTNVPGALLTIQSGTTSTTLTRKEKKKKKSIIGIGARGV